VPQTLYRMEARALTYAANSACSKAIAHEKLLVARGTPAGAASQAGISGTLRYASRAPSER